MPRTSAGILAFRLRKSLLELFLVHPGGPFYSRKDLGVWTIPKGEYEEEDPLEAARREFFEETGVQISGKFLPLTPFKQKSGKVITAWALETDLDTSELKSNLFEMEWPPRSGQKKSFPEIDRGEWFGVDEALQKILPAQQVMIHELRELLRV